MTAAGKTLAEPRTAEIWKLVRERKLTHWARRYREAGANGALEVAEDLREHMRLLNPDWPTKRERQEDLAHHVKMRALFDKAAHALVFHARRRSTR